MPQLSSKRPGLMVNGNPYGYVDILNNHLNLRATYDSRLVWSGSWSSFQKGDFYVTVAAEPFYRPEDANAWCDKQGFRAEDCFAKRLSTVTGPREASSAGDAPIRPSRKQPPPLVVALVSST